MSEHMNDSDTAGARRQEAGDMEESWTQHCLDHKMALLK